MVYVAGFIWAEIKQLYQEGLHQYMVRKFVEYLYKICYLIQGGYMESIRLDNKLFVCSYYCSSSYGIY